MFPMPIRKHTNAALFDWFGAGGIPKANVLAAFKPIGAASLAASYVNLVTPGTNDAAPGTAPTWDAVNGWNFTAASSQYLVVGSGALVTAVPLTMICLFQSSDVTGTYDLLVISNNLSAANQFSMTLAGGIASDPIRASISGGGGETGANSALPGYTASTWYVGAAKFISATSRFAYSNGNVGSENTTSRTPASINTTTIGVKYNGATPINYHNGLIGACAFYNIALFDAQVLSVSNAMLAMV